MLWVLEVILLTSDNAFPVDIFQVCQSSLCDLCFVIRGNNSVWPSKKTHMVRKSLKIKWNIINNLWWSQTAKEIKTRLKAQQRGDYSLYKSEGLSKSQVPCCWPQSFVQGDDPWAIQKPYKISFESIKITLYMVTVECCYNPRATWETESGERPRVPGSLSNIVRFQHRNNGT